MNAVGYIRQSRRADLDVALSPESQRLAIRTMAERDGIDPDAVDLYADLGRSGAGGKESLRPQYQALMKRLQAGSVDVLYALSMTRLARSSVELRRVADLCKKHGTRLVFQKEGQQDPKTSTGRLFFNLISDFAEFERDLAVERALDNAAVRRARGEKMGRIAYGEVEGDDVDAVLDAFQATGSLNAAALRLNGAGLPTRLGRKWTSTSVRNVIERNRPELLPPVTRRGARTTSATGFRLYRLVVCPRCGGRMTSWRDKRDPDGRAYLRCHRADGDPNHPSTRVPEARLIPAVEAEWARYDNPDERAPSDGRDVDAQRADLMAARQRVIDMRADGLIDRDESRRRTSDIDTKLAALVAPTVRPRINIANPIPDPREYNRVMTDLFERIELDPNTLDVSRIVWRYPEWRYPPAE